MNQRYSEAPTQTLRSNGNDFAYRLLGGGIGVPLVLLNHWGANLDNFDPAIVNALAVGRSVYALDYRGVGRSGGRAPLSIQEMADDMVSVVRALGLQQIDLLGFSLGGFVAQEIALREPVLVRRLILTGTGPAGGVGINRVRAVSWPLIIRGLLTFTDPKTFLFFTRTDRGRQAAKQFLLRLKNRRQDRDTAVTLGVFLRQLTAIRAWGEQPPQDLAGLHMPVLIANGDDDIMVPTENSRDMARRIPGAELHIYEDAGHGGIFQYHAQFIEAARKFLDR